MLKLNMVLAGKITCPKTNYDFGWHKVASQWKDEFERRLFNFNHYAGISDYKSVYSNMSTDNVTLVDKNIMTDRYSFALDKMMEYGCKTLLDVGTFDGALAVYASRIGVASVGIDINTTFIEVGRSVSDASKCKLIGGVAFEEFETPQRFDCVSATEVIEHVLDVDSFLKKCHSLLNDGGIVTISTPYRLGRYGITNHDIHHIRHYDLEMLEADTSKYFETRELKVSGDLINFCGVKK
jgi:2-polyprenyl-3-methyl-5-hydroxy-6-metoxy-1,4-benzoquinol methylase